MQAGWQAHAERALERLGLQRSDNELTPSEYRIATLAASGLTNATVAARLSLSPKTVEAHLTRIYTSSASTPAPSWASGWPSDLPADRAPVAVSLGLAGFGLAGRERASARTRPSGKGF